MKSINLFFFALIIILIPQFLFYAENIKDSFNYSTLTKKENIINAIESEIKKMKPLIGDNLNEKTISNICALARGEKKQRDIISEMISEGKDINQLKISENPEALLVNDNSGGRSFICASYIANLNYLDIDASILNSYTENVQYHINNETMSNLNVRLSIARANSELFLNIAKKLSIKKHSSLQELETDIKNEFYNNSEQYLLNVKNYYLENKNKIITLNSIGPDLLRYSISDWIIEISKDKTPILIKKGILWHGAN